MLAFDTGVLYKKDSKFRIREWRATATQVDGEAYYTVISGLHGGDLRTTTREIVPSSRLTATKRAVSKAKSSKILKMKKGYFTSIDEAEKYISNKLQLLHNWYDHRDKIVYPCFVSPKLDGICAGYKDGDSPFMMSRENNEFPKLYPVAYKINAHLVDILGRDRHLIDCHGELYAHGRNVSELVEAIKGSNDEVLDEIKYYVFDYMVGSARKLSYKDRLNSGKNYFKWGRKDLPFELIKIQVAECEADVDLAYKEALDQGFEGVVVSNFHDEGYEYGKRSHNRLKRKELLSQEFKVIRNIYDVLPEGKAIKFVCECEGGEFTVVPKWSRSRRVEEYKSTPTGIFMDKYATVEFRSWTTNKKPFHPVLIAFRDYE